MSAVMCVSVYKIIASSSKCGEEITVRIKN